VLCGLRALAGCQAPAFAQHAHCAPIPARTPPPGHAWRESGHAVGRKTSGQTFASLYLLAEAPLGRPYPALRSCFLGAHSRQSPFGPKVWSLSCRLADHGASIAAATQIGTFYEFMATRTLPRFLHELERPRILVLRPLGRSLIATVWATRCACGRCREHSFLEFLGKEDSSACARKV